ncbi:MAG: hypothetical protein SPK49_06045 [Erysipelotrichaceae bacterium]|nr:hypothetical protein [Erysipelotrichaceae bacterium]
MIKVSKIVLKKYLNLEIGDMELFPDDAPVGTSFYDLQPENDAPEVCTLEHVVNLLNLFISGEIDDNRVKEWVESMIALDLFDMEDEDDRRHDLVVSTIYTLDELKDVNGKITIDDAKHLLQEMCS